LVPFIYKGKILQGLRCHNHEQDECFGKVQIFDGKKFKIFNLKKMRFLSFQNLFNFFKITKLVAMSINLALAA
jgi:hypothetical protein